MSDSKPCPFCGSTEIEMVSNFFDNDGERSREWMRCRSCNACGPEASPRDETNAEMLWEHREDTTIKYGPGGR